MNILFLSGLEIKPSAGGVQMTTSIIARFLKEKGHNVYFLAILEGSTYNTPDEIQHYFMPPITRFNYKKSRRYLIRFIEDNCIDIIVNQCGPMPSAIKLLLKRKSTAKVVTVVHGTVTSFIKGYDLTTELLYGKTFIARILNNNLVKRIVLLRHIIKYSIIYRKIIRKGDALVLFSNGNLQELRTYLKKVTFEKIHVIPNACIYQAPHFDSLEKEKILLYVGRLADNPKRCSLLLRIWESLYKDFPDWSLYMVGDGYSRKALPEYVKKQGIERVVFTGNTNPIEFYKRAPIFCMTSAHEGFPMVLPEAMNFGAVPVVFNSFASASDIIQNSNTGFLIEEGGLKEYTSVLASLMQDKSLCKKMGRAAMKSVERYSVQNIGDKWLTLLEGL